MAGQLNGLNTDDHKDTFFLLFLKVSQYKIQKHNLVQTGNITCGNSEGNVNCTFILTISTLGHNR